MRRFIIAAALVSLAAPAFAGSAHNSATVNANSSVVARPSHQGQVSIPSKPTTQNRPSLPSMPSKPPR